VLARIALPPVAVVLAPNHTGRCTAPGGASVWPRGEFVTPLATVPLAEALADALPARCDLTADDRIAHTGEHAIEVELPFLQALGGTVEILPIVLAWDDWRRAEELATALAELVAKWPQRVLLLASSDMTHYESAGRAATKDRVALEAIGRLDGEGLLAACRREHITMCGRAPAAVVVEDREQDGHHHEERHQRVEHRDPRLDQVQEVDRQETRRGEGASARRHGWRVAQQPPNQHVEQRNSQDPGQGGDDPPPDLVIAEQLDPQADHPVAERRVGAAGQLVDPAGIGPDDVAAGVLGVPDLVEHEADGSGERGQAQDGRPGGDDAEGDPVEPRPTGLTVDRFSLLALGCGRWARLRARWRSC